MNGFTSALSISSVPSTRSNRVASTSSPSTAAIKFENTALFESTYAFNKEKSTALSHLHAMTTALNSLASAKVKILCVFLFFIVAPLLSSSSSSSRTSSPSVVSIVMLW